MNLTKRYNCEMFTVNCYLQNTCRVWVGSSLWTLPYLVNYKDAATTYVFGFLFLAEMFISQRTLPAWLLVLLLSIASKVRIHWSPQQNFRLWPDGINTSVHESGWRGTLRIQSVSPFHIWEHSSSGLCYLAYHCLVQSQNGDPNFGPTAPYSCDQRDKYPIAISNLQPVPSI